MYTCKSFGIFFSFLFLFLLSLPSTASATSGTWTQHTAAGSRNWVDVESSDDGTKLVAIVYNGYIYTSDDSGATWTARTSAGSRGWWSVASSADGMKLAAANYNGYIYTSTDGGVNWTERTGASSPTWYGLASSADGMKLAAADPNGSSGGYIRTSTDGGATWTTQTGSGARQWYTIDSSADGMKLVAGDNEITNSYIYTSTNGGVTWTARTGAGSGYWYGVASSADGSTIIGGRNDFNNNGSYIFISTDGGATWTQSISTVDTSTWWNWFSSSADGTKFVATDSAGHVYTSEDGGENWIDQTSDVGTDAYYAIDSSADGTKVIITGYTGYLHSGVFVFPEEEEIEESEDEAEEAKIDSWKATLVSTQSSCSQKLKVSITGRHFNDHAKVFIGGREASSVTVDSSKKLTARFCLNKLLKSSSLKKNISVENPDTDAVKADKKIDLSVFSPAANFNQATEEGVMNIQKVLVYLKFLPKAGVTGIYDASTQSAVKIFQQQYNISPTGFVGPQTEAALRKISQ